MAFDLNDYVDVATRLRQAHERWPELRIEEHLPVVITVIDRTFIQSTVTVHRQPDDPLPTTATVWEPWPGQTSFSKNSEVMVGNTSALGRALAYMGLEVRKSIASRDEVAARQTPAPRPTAKDRTPADGASVAQGKELARITALLDDCGIEGRDLKLVTVCGIIGRDVASSRELTRPEAHKVIEHLTMQLAARKPATDDQ